MVAGPGFYTAYSRLSCQPRHRGAQTGAVGQPDTAKTPAISPGFAGYPVSQAAWGWPQPPLQPPRAQRLFVNMPGFEQDWQWAKAMDGVVLQATQLLPGFASARELLMFLAQHYQSYKSREAMGSITDAVTNPYYRPQDSFLFGELRTSGRATPPTEVSGRYLPYRDRAAALARALSRGGRIGIMQAPLGGEMIPLTTTVVTRKGVKWVHTPVENVDKVLRHIEPLYRHTLQLASAPRNAQTMTMALGNVAAIHWLLVQAMPFYRGSAGIADMFSKVLLDRLGITSGNWRPGLAPDLEALVMPLDRYVMAYPTFFQRPPAFMRR